MNRNLDLDFCDGALRRPRAGAPSRRRAGHGLDGSHVEGGRAQGPGGGPAGCSGEVRGDVPALLRSAPFHRWASLRALMRDSELPVFDAAAEQIRAQWSDEDWQAQLRACMTTVATEVVLAMPDWNGATVVREHLDNAAAALQAAAVLAQDSDVDVDVA